MLQALRKYNYLYSKQEQTPWKVIPLSWLSWIQVPNTLAVSVSRATNPFFSSSSFGLCVHFPSSRRRRLLPLSPWAIDVLLLCYPIVVRPLPIHRMLFVIEILSSPRIVVVFGFGGLWLMTVFLSSTNDALPPQPFNRFHPRKYHPHTTPPIGPTSATISALFLLYFVWCSSPLLLPLVFCFVRFSPLLHLVSVSLCSQCVSFHLNPRSIISSLKNSEKLPCA